MKERETERNSSRLKRNLKTATVGTATIAVGAAAYHAGFQEVLDFKIDPQPEVIPGVVNGMVAVNEGLRFGAPFAAAGVLGSYAYYSLASGFNRKQATLNRLSKTEYSGINDIEDTQEDTHRVGNKIRTFRRGTSVAALAILLTGATSAVENEVTNGPLRPIHAMTQVLGAGNKDVNVLLQSKNNTFMDDSYITDSTMSHLQADGHKQGIEIIPFKKNLLNINGKSGLEIAVPDSLFTTLTSQKIDRNCDNAPVIIDETVGAKTGEAIDINGNSAQVVAVKKDLAQMHRSIAIVSETDMRECFMHDSDSSYYGAIVPNVPYAELKKFIQKEAVRNVDVVSESNFKESNLKFWKENVTPVLLQLIAYLTIFGGFAAAGERKNALQRNVREIGMLHAAGVDMKDIQAIEQRRAISETLKAAIIAAPLMPLVAGAFNIAEVGMQVGVGVRELSVGISVTALAKIIGSRRAVNSFEEKLDISQAVKG